MSGSRASIEADDNGYGSVTLFALSVNAASLVWRVQIGSRLHTPVLTPMAIGGETYFAVGQVGPFTLADHNLPVVITATNAWGTSTVQGSVFVRGKPASFTGAGAVQPASVSVNLGASAVLAATATGSGTLRYQWKKDGANLTGATLSSYPIPAAQLSDAGSYSVVATNDYGTATSTAVTVKVVILPVTFTQQPQSRAVALGSSLTLQVGVTGSLPISYQWRKDGVNVDGATNAWLSLPNVRSADLGDYYVFVVNPAGAVSSATARLVLADPPPPPPPPSLAITQHPQAATILAGGNATFQVTATGTGPLAYQWLKDNTPLPGATAATLAIAAAQPAHAGVYTVAVTNAAGTMISTPAALVVNLPLVAPTIASPPRPQERLLGASVEFTVTASGSPPLVFQWTKNGAPIPGETRATLALASIRHADAGSYAVAVSNAAGSVTSAGATLAVANPGRLANLSLLATLTSSDDPLSLGFVLGGAGTTGSLPLLIRAAGPSLVPFGVGHPLADPRLEIFTGAVRHGANDDWGGNEAVHAAAMQVGAFSFSSGASKDAAFFAPALGRGEASVKVSGAPGNTGTVIAELYDASPRAALTIETPRLINLSVLKALGSGLTTGFVIDGTTELTLLIRAVGPSLASFGVSDFAADPRIELRGRAGGSLGQNNDWGGTAALLATFMQVGAFPLPNASKDAALVVRLAPGTYTVDVTDTVPNAGLALVEIYELP